MDKYIHAPCICAAFQWPRSQRSRQNYRICRL